MTRLSSITLLLLFLLNLIGGTSLLLIQRFKRHEAVESMISSEAYRHHLTRLHIAVDQQDEIKWVEADKEFRYQGEMYDLVRTEIYADGSITYYVIPDHAETHLYSEIESNLDGMPLSHHGDRMIVLQLFKCLASFQDEMPQDKTINLYTAQKINSFYLVSFPDVNLSLPSKPPEQV